MNRFAPFSEQEKFVIWKALGRYRKELRGSIKSLDEQTKKDAVECEYYCEKLREEINASQPAGEKEKQT